MKKIRLTENDLVRIIEKVVKEESGKTPKNHPGHGREWGRGNDKLTDEDFEEIKSYLINDASHNNFNIFEKSKTYGDVIMYNESEPNYLSIFVTSKSDPNDVLIFNNKEYAITPEQNDELFSIMKNKINGNRDMEDDFEFQDSELAEMKRKVRVMENKLRRRKQMRRRR
jgi:hypothetical protein